MSCVGIACAIYAALAIIGAPIWLLVRTPSPPVSDALACPLIGFAVFDLFSWYWLRYAAGGLVRGLPVLTICVVVALVLVLRRSRDEFHTPALARCASTAALLTAVAAVFLVEFRVPLRLGHLTSASIWNADAAQYANVARGLVSHGFSWTGNIAGVNLGTWATDARGIGPGVYSALAAVAASAGLGTWQVTLPLLLVGVALGALAVRDAARIFLPGSLVAAPIIALLATSASLFGYITTNYFLAQVLVMPLVLGELIVLHWIARKPGWRERIPGLTLLAAIVVTAALSYSPMAFAMQPIIVGAVCLGEVGRGWLRRSAEVVASTIGAFGVTFVLAPEPFARSANYVRVSLGTQRGWPLGLMTPIDALGLRQAIRTPRPSVGVFLIETFVVGVLVAVAVWALWNERRRAAILGAAVTLLVLGSYAAVYAERGYSYEQWKWIAFFQPAFIAAVFSMFVAAGGALIRRWMPEPRATNWLVAAVFGVVLIATSARTLVSGTQHTRAVWAEGQPALRWSIVDPSLSQLAKRPELSHLKAVNVNLPQWDAMWAAYFLQPTKRVYLLSPSYFPVSRPKAPLTITAEPDPSARVGFRYVIKAQGS